MLRPERAAWLHSGDAGCQDSGDQQEALRELGSGWRRLRGPRQNTLQFRDTGAAFCAAAQLVTEGVDRASTRCDRLPDLTL